MFEEFDAAVQLTVGDNQFIQMWMSWMMIITFLSVLFIWKYKTARYILGSLFLIMPIAMGIFGLTGKVHLIGIAHLLIWGPLAYYLCYTEKVLNIENMKSPYRVWLTVFFITIIIAMLFDIRDIILVLLGQK